MQWLNDHIVPATAIAIVVLGLFVYGLGDLLRFSFKRIWAISGVCFDESIRRRVLWIIPLAILGLVIVVQLQQPFDEQDAIRETTKFCLFATGMVVVISTIILACTNLPREIENRVIFTVVTKPTTRLEIVLGKITGFARVSATILLIMGVFSFAYLHFRAWSLESDLRDRLKANLVEPISRPRSEHYVTAGLLNAKTLASANVLGVYGVRPDLSTTVRESTFDGMTLVPFHLPADILLSDATDSPGMIVQVKVGYTKVPPVAPAPGKPVPAPEPPKIGLQVFDQNVNSLLTGEIKGSPAVIPSADGTQSVNFVIPANDVGLLTHSPYIYMVLTNGNADGRFWLRDDPTDPPVRLIVPVASQSRPLTVFPSDQIDPKQPGHPVFMGREGVSGMQVKGDPSGKSQVAVYEFHGASIEHGQNDLVPVELRVGIEKNGEVTSQDVPTDASITVLNLKTGKESPPVLAQPENNRPFYLSIPASFTDGGDFDLIVRCLSPEQWLNLKKNSIFIVQAENSFAFNLFKSTLILWLLSILVTAIAVFSSTFLSWPIAVVLTLVILLGRWGVNALGDSATAGIGRQFTTDMGVRDPAAMMVLSNSVESLNKALKTVSAVLPDIEQFAATDDIDRGIAIPFNTVESSLWVLISFGLPLTVLAYIFLRNKEVAP